MFGKTKHKSEILTILNEYENIYNDYVESSDLESPKTLCLNGKKQHNSMLNFKDKPVDIKTNLEESPNIL